MPVSGASHASASLTIELDAIAANYRALVSAAGPADVAAVVKAHAYGLGAIPVSRALVAAGCEHFFVAQLGEALALRAALPPETKIYVLNGLWVGSESKAVAANLTPVLNSIEQVQRWNDQGRRAGVALPAVLQLDSGMSRLGLTSDAVGWLAGSPDALSQVQIVYVMTHLACAGRPGDAANQEQLTVFDRLARPFAEVRRSFAASAAVMAHLGAPCHPGDLVRAGLALYGANPFESQQTLLRTVVRASARVLQVRTIPAGVGVGYGRAFVAPGPTQIATIAVGYADGWPRRLGGRAHVYLGSIGLPIIGRISMDTLTVDASVRSPGTLQAGDEVELIGPHQTLEEVARLAETIPYEILTGLGDRFARIYADGPPANHGPKP